MDGAEEAGRITLLVGGSPDQIERARELAAEGREVAVFVDPARALLATAVWRSLAYEGVRLGADPFGPYAVDGELPNWPLSAVAHEVGASVRFFSDVLDVPCAGFALPGPNPTCGEGDYLALLLATELPVYGWPGASEREGVVPTGGAIRREDAVFEPLETRTRS